jgi:Polyketide cyclase / dehydrase and lipid transport
MKTISVTQRIAISADSAWNIIRTGANMNRWFPPVTACRLEGAGVGAKRFCTVHGHELEESIETVDDVSRIFQYRILKQSLMPIQNIVGTVHVTAVSPAEAEVLWFVNFDLTDESALPGLQEGIASMYRAGIAGLETYAKAA